MEGMTTRARIATLLMPLVGSVLALAVAPPAAGADGQPVVGVDASPIQAPGEGVAYMTRRAGTGTALEVIDADSRRRLRRVVVKGRLTVPVVAYDATPSGLSADGRTLALIQPRRALPHNTTRFALADTETLRIRRRFALKGDFSFDALSPDARTMYLIRYLSPRDPARYEVRAYDLRRERLLKKPIVDPREPDERMNGWPMTRATGPGGRWEYTLYKGSEYAFIHALDTEKRRAFCIDLEGMATGPDGLWHSKLDLDGSTLAVLAGKRTLASVDTTTLRARIAGHRNAAIRRTERETDDGVPWLLVLGLPLLAGAALVVVLRRRAGLRRTTRAETA
jgi:LPXTG-motif cell wall-anchored protein